jgi:hypothetical protein
MLGARRKAPAPSGGAEAGQCPGSDDWAECWRGGVALRCETTEEAGAGGGRRRGRSVMSRLCVSRPRPARVGVVSRRSGFEMALFGFPRGVVAWFGGQRAGLFRATSARERIGPPGNVRWTLCAQEERALFGRPGEPAPPLAAGRAKLQRARVPWERAVRWGE